MIRIILRQGPVLIDTLAHLDATLVRHQTILYYEHTPLGDMRSVTLLHDTLDNFVEDIQHSHTNALIVDELRTINRLAHEQGSLPTLMAQIIDMRLLRCRNILLGCLD